MSNCLLDAGEQRSLPPRGNCGAHCGRAHRMLGRRGIENCGAQPVAVSVAELKLSELLGMRIEQPGMIDEREQNERLARGKRGAQTANERTSRKPRARHGR